MIPKKEVICMDVPEVLLQKLEQMRAEEGFDTIGDVVTFIIRYYFDKTEYVP